MHRLELTIDQPAANLALDEALLESAEEPGDNPVRPEEMEVLRLWEPARPFVVLGRSSPIQQEVHRENCRKLDIPVFRRCSGGATIVTGPGCLMYAVVLSYANKPELRKLDEAHNFVMNRMKQALGRLNIEAEIQGTSDLTLGSRKVSGNSLRCRRHFFLYHGTFICDFDLSLISKCLGDPRRQPAYRAARTHDQFLTRLPVDTKELSEAIIEQWEAEKISACWPRQQTDHLTTNKYLTEHWINLI
jgi:lipoate---protein ligase